MKGGKPMTLLKAISDGSHGPYDMTIYEAIKRACEKPMLLDALTWICLWESECVVRQALTNCTYDGITIRRTEAGKDQERGWDTCFKVCLGEVMEAWNEKHEQGKKEGVGTILPLLVEKTRSKKLSWTKLLPRLRNKENSVWASDTQEVQAFLVETAKGLSLYLQSSPYQGTPTMTVEDNQEKLNELAGMIKAEEIEEKARRDAAKMKESIANDSRLSTSFESILKAL